MIIKIVHKREIKCCLLILIIFALSACAISADKGNPMQYQALESTNPGYRQIRPDELDDLAREFFKDQYNGNDPFFVAADFDGNGLSDIAALLNSVNPDNGKTRLTILLQFERNSYKSAYIKDLDSIRNDVFIVPVEKGVTIRQAEAIDEHKDTVILEHDAIQMVYFGKSAVVVYLDAKTEDFKATWIAD